MTKHRCAFRLAAIAFAVSLCAAPVTANTDGTATPSLPGWHLVWADEFNRDGPPDPRNWSFEEGFVRNQEAQWYEPGNAYVKHGLLVIEARRERQRNPQYEAKSTDWKKNREFAEYTSACLTTSGRQSFTYGRWEIRAKIDTRAGLWPAFWTVGTQGEWPSGGEIDIMEYYRGMVLANAAWAAPKRWTAAWSTVRKPLATFHDANWSAKFHIWRMDWDKNWIRLSVDGTLVNQIDLSKTLNPDGTNPFHSPQFILLNLAIGGQSGGDPSQTKFPARFLIDYVRVYQKNSPP